MGSMGCVFICRKDVNIHGVITDGGVAANVVPEYAAGRFYLRAANRATLDEVYEKVENIVKGAALATGTTYEFGLFQNSVDDVIVTPSFDELFFCPYSGSWRSPSRDRCGNKSKFRLFRCRKRPAK